MVLRRAVPESANAVDAASTDPRESPLPKLRVEVIPNGIPPAAGHFWGDTEGSCG